MGEKKLGDKKKIVDGPKDKRIPKKVEHRQKLLEYLGNPSNKMLDRQELSTVVLGFAHASTIHQVFTPDELYEIYDEALRIRRSRYAASLSDIDLALMASAKKGDAQAAKLVYQRLEGWREAAIRENQGATKIVITRKGLEEDSD